MPLTPIQRYRKDLTQSGFQQDAAQLNAVERLQRLYDQLIEPPKRPTWLRKLLGRSEQQRIKGIYLWGGVGRGKTYLMDLFYESLPFKQKHRTHFHRFMRRVHEELTRLKGSKNPLQKVADSFADEARVICFDEFFVADITDAMILANLLEALFERGVILVATSNIAPEGLYQDGLQRVRFLPAIALLNLHTDILNVDAGIDYRLRQLTQAELFYSPLSASAELALQNCFERLAPDYHTAREAVPLEIEGRVIVAKKVVEDVVWFDFYALCDGPRSQNDYIVLAKEYHAVLITGVPHMGRNNDDQARRFIYLVDEFYDRGVKLIISAAASIERLYGEGKLQFEFARTVSRLREMQSEDYLAQAHKP